MLTKLFTAVSIISLGSLLATYPPISPATAGTDTATYSLTFESVWSDETHPNPPNGLPGSAHYSSLIGGIHSDQIIFWAENELASAGIEQMAETGGTSSFRNEVNTAIEAGTASAILSGGGLSTSSGTVVIDSFEVSQNFPLVTLTSMIAPSPDWFIGVHGVSLLDQQGEWVLTKTITLYPYDAGTEDGPTYSLNNPATSPPDPIKNIQGEVPFSDQPLGTFTFTRTDVPPKRRQYLPIVINLSNS